MSTVQSAREHIDKKLLLRLRMFLFISLGLVVYIARVVWIGDLSTVLALLGMGIGFGVGLPLGRMMSVKWRESDEKAISELDIAGGIALAGFVAMDLSRNWIFGHWLTGPALTAFTLSVLAGALFGRFLGMGISIRRVLEAQK